MSADFFRGKISRAVSVLVAVCFTAFCGIYASVLSRAKIIIFQKGFFYLVREGANAEVGAEFIKLEGGAGYLLSKDGADYAVLSLYAAENDALAVQASLQKDGNSAQIVYVGVETLYFKTAKEKKNADVFIGALETLYSYIGVFNETAAMLENGATQEQIKRILRPFSRQILCLGQEYQQIYPAFSTVCLSFSEKVAERCENILFAGNLRYDICEIAGDFFALADAFSI